jgi:protocatechuate 3,4-dioxygenase beta subunit
MDHDDAPIGRVLTRREILALAGSGGAALLVSRAVFGAGPLAKATAKKPATQALTSCIARPELTEGPYFVEEGLLRSDIRADPRTGIAKLGVPLEIVFHLSKLGDSACDALENALVDVWHCDALGSYSDTASEGTLGQKFLRGQQKTDAQGAATFKTIYPGWYQGRAVHIHFKIRVPLSANKTYEFTSQFFFDEKLTDKVHSQAPYNQKGLNRLRNEYDGIYQQGGNQLVLDLKPSGEGYRAVFEIGLDLSKPTQGGGNFPGGPGGPGGPPGPPPGGRSGNPFLDW